MPFNPMSFLLPSICVRLYKQLIWSTLSLSHSVARVLDGVDVRGFYVWKLQDHHAPDFGFFLSPHHRSRPKASVTIYRQLVSQRGFPPISDPLTSPCEPSVSQSECLICENKPMLFFGVCVTISVTVLASVMVIGIMRRSRRKRRKKTRQRNMGRAMGRVVYRIWRYSFHSRME